METKSNPAQLSTEVAKKYKLKEGISTDTMVLPDRYGRQTVIWSKLTVAEAEALVAMPNFPYLIPLAGNTPPKTN